MALSDTIAIDGPAASGKSTLAGMLAEKLQYLFFDTGVMYRAVTLAALERGLDVNDEAACQQLAEEIHIDVVPSQADPAGGFEVLIDEQIRTQQIRQPQVDANVSVVSAYAGVRQALSRQQRRIGLQGKVVMVGRDIGTVVLPEAGFKIFLVASVEERARRRYQECAARGDTITFDEVLSSMRARDQIDTNRQVAPLRAAEDAIVVNSDGLSIAEVFTKIKTLFDTYQRSAT
jgi:cytidylate kinase